jgi:hypothetical protein
MGWVARHYLHLQPPNEAISKRSLVLDISNDDCYARNKAFEPTIFAGNRSRYFHLLFLA